MEARDEIQAWLDSVRGTGLLTPLHMKVRVPRDSPYHGNIWDFWRPHEFAYQEEALRAGRYKTGFGDPYWNAADELAVLMDDSEDLVHFFLLGICLHLLMLQGRSKASKDRIKRLDDEVWSQLRASFPQEKWWWNHQSEIIPNLYLELRMIEGEDFTLDCISVALQRALEQAPLVHVEIQRPLTNLEWIEGSQNSWHAHADLLHMMVVKHGDGTWTGHCGSLDYDEELSETELERVQAELSRNVCDILRRKVRSYQEALMIVGY